MESPSPAQGRHPRLDQSNPLLLFQQSSRLARGGPVQTEERWCCPQCAHTALCWGESLSTITGRPLTSARASSSLTRPSFPGFSGSPPGCRSAGMTRLCLSACEMPPGWAGWEENLRGVTKNGAEEAQLLEMPHLPLFSSE